MNDVFSGQAAPAFSAQVLRDVLVSSKREGGEKTVSTKYAIREDVLHRQYVTLIHRGGTFAYNDSLNRAALFSTSSEAFAAIDTRNRRSGPTACRFSVVPVTVTETTAVYELIETPGTPAKTVYRIRRDGVSVDARVSYTDGLEWGAFDPAGHTPTDFTTADAAFEAIKRRDANYGWAPAPFHVRQVVIPGTPAKTERKLVTPASTTRSL